MKQKKPTVLAMVVFFFCIRTYIKGSVRRTSVVAHILMRKKQPIVSN